MFPCDDLKAFAYDENEGDNGLRIENCRMMKRRNMLTGKKAVIFDMDGTLIDSVGIWNDVDRILLTELGITDMSSEEIQAMRDEKLREYASCEKPYIEYCRYLGEISSCTLAPEEIHDRRYIIADEFLRNGVDYKEDAEVFLKKLKEKGFILAIASTTKRNNLEIYQSHNPNIISKAPINEYFDIILSREDVKKMKPDGEVFILASEKLGLKKEECIIIEDSVTGLQAAKDAEIDCAVIYDRYSEKDTPYLMENAEYYFTDYPQILREVCFGND